QVDHEELALLVAVPGQRLGLHVHAGMPRLEVRDQPGDGIALAEDMGVLEDQGDGRRRARPIRARGHRAERREQQAGGQGSAAPGYPLTAHDRAPAAPDQKLKCTPIPTYSTASMKNWPSNERPL